MERVDDHIPYGEGLKVEYLGHRNALGAKSQHLHIDDDGGITHGADESGDARGPSLSYGPQGQAVHEHRAQTAESHGQNERRPEGQAELPEKEDEQVRAAHHEGVVCKVDESQHAVDHAIAHGHQGIDAANGQAVDNLLKKHPVSPSPNL